MKFLCSAIKVIPQNTTGFIIISGKRHYNCIETISKLGIKRDKNNDTQGFIVLIDGFGNICRSL